MNQSKVQGNGRVKNGFQPGSGDENQDYANARTPLIPGLCLPLKR